MLGTVDRELRVPHRGCARGRRRRGVAGGKRRAGRARTLGGRSARGARLAVPSRSRSRRPCPAAPRTSTMRRASASTRSRFTPESVQLAYQICAQGRADLAIAPDEATGFAMTLLRLLAFEPAGGDSASPSTRSRRGRRPPRTPSEQSTTNLGTRPRREGAATSSRDDAPTCARRRAGDAAPKPRRARAARRSGRVAGVRRESQADRPRRAARRAKRAALGRGQRASTSASRRRTSISRTAPIRTSSRSRSSRRPAAS